MDTASRTPIVADLTRAAIRSSMTQNAGIPRGVTSSAGRLTSRTRIRTLNHPSPNEKSATASLRISGSSYLNSSSKVTQEGRGLVLLINRLELSYTSGRRLAIWFLLLLVWGYIGFHMQIRWADLQHIRVFQASEDEQGLSTLGIGDHLRFSSAIPDPKTPESSETFLPTYYPLNDHQILRESENKVGKEGTGLWIGGNFVEFHNDYHHGNMVSPSNETERHIRNSRQRTCSRKGLFPNFVRGKNIVVVFHEVPTTGAPLAVLELASEMVNCGGNISAIVLKKTGGAYKELVQRGIIILRDKFIHSWKAAAEADLVVAASAACNTWIGQYLRYKWNGGELLVWWLTENQREYFDRSRRLLGKARALVFQSQSQELLWRRWASEASVILPSIVEVVSWSVNDAVAALAGLDAGEAGRDGSVGAEAFKERDSLRNQVRNTMGLESSDYLVISLSSIDPGNEQLMMLHAALMLAEGVTNDSLKVSAQIDTMENFTDAVATAGTHGRKEIVKTRNLKLFLGSGAGCKSTEPIDLERVDGLINRQPSLANMLLRTEIPVLVGPLYAAADAFVMSAQGSEEMFGRGTIEAMAFGLPVLGSDAGVTKEIFEANVTGLVHPAGEFGIPVLARHLRKLLNHPEVGVEIGDRGRERVRQMFREGPMYEALARIFVDVILTRGGWCEALSSPC